MLPTNFIDAIRLQADTYQVPKSQQVETLIRNGIAVYLKMEEYIRINDTAGLNLCSTIIRSGFNGIQISTGGTLRLTGKRQLSANPKERMVELTMLHRDMEKVRTTITITDGLTEYMIHVSEQLDNVPMSLVVFLYLQTAFMAWQMRGSIDEESVPEQDREYVMNLLEELKQTIADFTYDEDGKLTVDYKKMEDGDAGSNRSQDR